MKKNRVNSVEAANQYIEQNKQNRQMRYRPRFHAVAPIGWINDPNGFYFDGKWYHLFYQHYPYSAKWNDMHWGHWRSKDLVVWEDLPVVMAPDKPYDISGCFSGTAVPDQTGGAHILYTGVSEEGKLQEQCYAYFDGKSMHKSDLNPVIPFSMLPEGYVRKDFRDPKLIKTADGYRAVMAAKYIRTGKLVSFSSPDLEHWHFDGVLCKTEGLMPECPDVFGMEGRTVVLYSKVPRKPDIIKNGRPILYEVGEFDPQQTSFRVKEWKRLDYGREIYATQTCEGKKGERIAVSWMASWESKYPTALMKHGWSGMMSLPRVLSLKNGQLVQEPVPGLKKYRGSKNCLETELDNAQANLRGVCARHAEIHIRGDVSNAETLTLNVMEDGDERVSLQWRDDTLTLDRSAVAYTHTGKFIPQISMPLKARGGKVEWTVYVDNCSIEIFAGGKTMSAIVFPDGEAYGLSVSAQGKASVNVECWNLCE